MSFRFKTLLGFFALITLSMFVITWGSLHLLKISHERELEKHTRQIAKFLTITLKDKIIQQDALAVTTFLQAFYRNSDIVYIRVITPPSTVLAKIGNTALLKHQFSEDLHVSDVKDGIFDTKANIYQTGQVIGYIEIGVLTISVFTALDEAKAQTTYYLLFLLSLALLFSFLLVNYLAHPLKQLVKPFHILTQKDATLISSHKDELIKTVMSFNRLTKKFQQTQQTLRQSKTSAEYSKQRLAAVLAHSGEGLVMINAEGIMLAFNPAAENMFSYEAATVLGKNVNLLMPEPYRSQHQSYISQYLATKKSNIIGIGKELTALRSDGKTFPVHLSICELQHLQENIFIGLIQDLTQQKEQEVKLNQVEALKNSILKLNPNSIIAINQTGHIIEFNSQAEQLFGHSRESVMGLTMDEVLMPYASRQAHRLGMERYLDSGESVVLGKWVEMMALHQKGHEFPINLIVMPTKVHENIIFIALLQAKSA